MKKWELFENDCLEFLNNSFGNSNLKFTMLGSSDSTISDIEVAKNGETLFLIEVKMEQAQSGQFATLLQSDKFIFSPSNKTDQNDEATAAILDYLNLNFSHFKTVGTSALKIDIPPSFFSDWVIRYYKSKGVKFVITSYLQEFVILPIEKYADYFHISANIRRKTSGSSNLPKTYLSRVTEYLNTILDSDFKIEKIENKQYLFTNSQIVDKYQVDLGDITIFIKKSSEQGKYVITKLGKTKNPTVIFSIQSKSPQCESDLNNFLENF